MQHLLILSADICVRWSLFLWQCSAFCFPIKSNLPPFHSPPRSKQQKLQQQTTERQPRQQQLSKTTTTNNYCTTNNGNSIRQRRPMLMNNKQTTIHKQQSTKPRTTNGDGHPTITNAIEQDGTAKFNNRLSMQIISA